MKLYEPLPIPPPEPGISHLSRSSRKEKTNLTTGTLSKIQIKVFSK
jgi:hypothetical protein